MPSLGGGVEYFYNLNIFYFTPRPAKLSTPQEGNLAQIHLRPKDHLLHLSAVGRKEDKKNYPSIFNPNTHSYQLAKFIVYYIGFFVKTMKKLFQNFIKQYNKYQLGILLGIYTGFFGVKNIFQNKFNHQNINLYLSIFLICIGIILIIYPRSSRNRKDKPK